MRKRRCGLIIDLDLGMLPRRAAVTEHIGRELQTGEENGMMTRKRLLLVMLVTMVIPLGAVGIRAISVSAAGTHEVPFEGSYSGTAVLTSPTSATFSGKGIATHLGASTNEAYSVVTGPDSSCPGGLANDHHETLTAANGDTLMLISYDVGCPMGPGMFHGIGHWVVTGGTGRFSGATGQGSFDGHSDFNQGVFSLQLTGIISAPNQS
jgi:hypothetical protein